LAKSTDGRLTLPISFPGARGTRPRRAAVRPVERRRRRRGSQPRSGRIRKCRPSMEVGCRTVFGLFEQAPLCRVGSLFEPLFQVGHLPLATGFLARRLALSKRSKTRSNRCWLNYSFPSRTKQGMFNSTLSFQRVSRDNFRLVFSQNLVQNLGQLISLLHKQDS